jgi:hypothetical protein
MGRWCTLMATQNVAYADFIFTSINQRKPAFNSIPFSVCFAYRLFRVLEKSVILWL